MRAASLRAEFVVTFEPVLLTFDSGLRLPDGVSDPGCLARQLRLRLAFTRYCIANIVWCMGYASGGRGGLYIAQQRCNSIALLWAVQVGGGNTRKIDSCIKASK